MSIGGGAPNANVRRVLRRARPAVVDAPGGGDISMAQPFLRGSPRWLGGPRWNRGGGSAPSVRVCGAYQRTGMTMKCAGTGKVTLNSYLSAGMTMVDRYPPASIQSQRSIGLGRDELKWEIQVNKSRTWAATNKIMTKKEVMT